MDDQGFYAYLLGCADGSLYAGWTTHPQRRLEAHNQGVGARYTRARRPVQLLYVWAFDTRREAMQFEYQLKRLSRAQKMALLQENGVNWNPASLASQ